MKVFKKLILIMDDCIKKYKINLKVKTTLFTLTF